jgi:hypothetical protein
MLFHRGAKLHFLPLLTLALMVVLAAVSVQAQSGSAGTVHGTVTDPSGAVIPGATVHLANSVSGFDRTTTTDPTGQFSFSNVPFNPYKIDVTANGFSKMSQSVLIRSSVGTSLKLVLQIESASQTVTVESGSDMVEDDPTFHTDVDRDMFTKVPLESASSGLSALVTQTSLRVFRPTRTASSTAWAITPPTPSPSTASPSPTSRARSSPTSFRRTPSSPSRSSAARPRPNTAAKPASSSRSPRAPARESPRPPAASPSYGTFGSPPAASISATAARTGATSSKSTASIPAASSIRPSSPSFTTRATRRTLFDRIDYSFTPPIPSTWT